MKKATAKPISRSSDRQKPRRARSAHSGGSGGLSKRRSGIVASYLSQSSPSLAGRPTAALIREIKDGIPIEELDALQAGLDVPMDRLFPMLGISKATLHRRRRAGRLDQSESDRLVRFARLLGKAVEVLETVENARLWLSSPQLALGGAVPLAFAETEVGAREVEDLLNRVEYGVYS